jgi:hypothetical protein
VTADLGLGSTIVGPLSGLCRLAVVIRSTRPPSPFRSWAQRVFNVGSPQVPADRNDDLAAAVDHDRDAGAIEPRTHDDLHDRDRQQRNEIDDHGSHLIPSTADLATEVSINRPLKFGLSKHYKNVFYRKIDPKPGVSV